MGYLLMSIFFALFCRANRDLRERGEEETRGVTRQVPGIHAMIRYVMKLCRESITASKPEEEIRVYHT